MDAETKRTLEAYSIPYNYVNYKRDINIPIESPVVVPEEASKYQRSLPFSGVIFAAGFLQMVRIKYLIPNCY